MILGLKYEQMRPEKLKEKMKKKERKTKKSPLLFGVTLNPECSSSV